MSNKSISQLTAGASVSSTDIFPDVQTAGVGPVKVTAAQIGNYVLSGSGLTGALPVANGGTGLTSLTAGYIPYGAGTSAFGSSSNLFWDSTNSRLGIGNTSPSYKLDVATIAVDVNQSGAVRFGANDQYSLRLGQYTNSGGAPYAQILSPKDANGWLAFTSGASDTERMRITATGTLNIVGAGTAGSTQAISFNGSAPINSMVLDVSGNLGVNVSNPSTYGGKLIVNGKSLFGGLNTIPTTSNSNGLSLFATNGVNGAYTTYTAGSTTGGLIIDAYSYNNGANYDAVCNIVAMPETWTNNGNGSLLRFLTAATSSSTPTEAMRIDKSGNVGIGTTSPGAILHIEKSAAAAVGPILFIKNSATTQSGTTGNSAKITFGCDSGASATGGNAYIQAQEDGSSSYGTSLQFATVANGGSVTERVRIDSSGNLLVGTQSSAYGQSGIVMLPAYTAAGNSGMAIFHTNGSANGSTYISFGYNATAIGSITQSGTGNIAVNGTSDYRLKENILDINNGVETINALRPVSFVWSADKSTDAGFIAHEFQTVIPRYVLGTKDAVDENGKPVYQQMDKTSVIPYLVAAVKELAAKVQALEAKVA